MLSLQFSSVLLVHRVQQHIMAPKLHARCTIAHPPALILRPYKQYSKVPSSPEGASPPATHSVPCLPRTHARVAVKKTRNIVFCCLKRQKQEVGKRKDLFFSTKLSRVLLSMVVTFCGYPRYLCAQAESCGGVDGGMTPTICLYGKKGVKTNCDAREFLFLCPANVLVFLSLRSLDTRL